MGRAENTEAIFALPEGWTQGGRGDVLSHQLKFPRARTARVLAGDIGATHSRLAIYGLQSGCVELLRQETYPSSQHAGLKEVLASFLETEQAEIQAACLGLPAPIHAGVVFPLTNLPWTVDQRRSSDQVLL